MIKRRILIERPDVSHERTIVYTAVTGFWWLSCAFQPNTSSLLEVIRVFEARFIRNGHFSILRTKLAIWSYRIGDLGIEQTQKDCLKEGSQKHF